MAVVEITSEQWARGYDRGSGADFYNNIKRGPDLYRELSYGEDPGFTDIVDDKVVASTSKYYSDPSTGLAITKGYFIEIYHIISQTPLFFKAFLTDFTDNFVVNYNKMQVIGRPDPIQTYQNTERTINVAFDLVSSNINEAKANLIKSNNLISMMYPAYDDGESATSLKSGPLFKVKMGNLICKPGIDTSEGTSPAMEAGLGCTIGGFKYDPVIEDGFFDPEPGIFYPQTIKIDLELSILHEQTLGFTGTGESRSGTEQNIDGTTVTIPGFPHGGAPALSLNGGTGDVRQDLPNGITQQNGIRNTLVRNEGGDLVEFVRKGNVVSNIYTARDADRQTREGERPGIRSIATLEGRVASERMRVQANKILSAKTRSQIGNVYDDLGGTFDNFITKGYFP